MKEHRDTNVVEMDCIEGRKNENCAILTFTFRNCSPMLMFLLEHKDSGCVLEVFIWLETVFEKEAFKKLFPALLTVSGKKGACEKNYEYITLHPSQG